MGLGSWLGRVGGSIRSGVGRTLAWGGGAVRKVSDFVGRNAKTIGMIGNVAGDAAAYLGALTAQPELMALGTGLKAGGQYLQSRVPEYAQQTNRVAGDVSRFGSKLARGGKLYE